jgi:DNA-binding beta-propeller fold protein YncE
MIRWRRGRLLAALSSLLEMGVALQPAAQASGPHPATGGTLLWAKQFGVPEAIKVPASLVVSPTGSSVFVTGHGGGYITVGYDQATGAELWNAVYPGGFAVAVAVSPDGTRVFVTGKIYQSGSGGVNFVTVAYDAASAEQLWVASYDGPASRDDIPCCIAVSPDGSTVYVTGLTRANLSTDYATVAYAAETGAQVWLSRFDSQHGHAKDEPVAMGVSPDGSKVFVTGTTRRHQPGGTRRDTDYGTVAYDARTGKTLWRNRYDSPTHHNDNTEALAVSPDGSTVAVAGDFYTVLYDAQTGAERWGRIFREAGSYPSAVAINPAGTRVFVTGGTITSGESFQFLTGAYDATTGDLVWLEEYGSPDHLVDTATSVAVSPDGTQVFVAGYSQDSSGNNYTTISYDPATGQTLWHATYSATSDSNDTPCCLGVSLEGSTVFVTGTTDNGTDFTSYLTLAFRT